MRRLMQRRVILSALFSGALVTAAALPYVLAAGGGPDLVRLRIACLFPLCVVLWQAVYAWSAPFPDRIIARSPRFGSRFAFIGVSSIVLAALFAVFLDPVLRECMPAQLPGDWGSWFRQWLWAGGFQNLVFDAGVYAFIVRLIRTRNPGRNGAIRLAVVAVAAARVLAAWNTIPGSTPAAEVLLITGASGLAGALHGIAYATCGFPGTLLVTTLLHLRHIARFL